MLILCLLASKRRLITIQTTQLGLFPWIQLTSLLAIHLSFMINLFINIYIYYIKRGFKINWSLITRSSSYSPSTDTCRLCLTEKHLLMQHPELGTLNVEDEFFASCRHKAPLLLSTVKWLLWSTTIFVKLFVLHHHCQLDIYSDERQLETLKSINLHSKPSVLPDIPLPMHGEHSSK